MKDPENVNLMQIDELTQRAKDLVTPIDFDELIASGVIEKKGAWYQINKWNELPEHAKAKISTVKSRLSSTGEVPCTE